MAVGKNIEKRNHIIGFQEEISKAKNEGLDSFFTWFNAGENEEEAFIRGHWDFVVHILQPMINYVKQPERLTICEIGHGGGRILSAAAGFFGNAIGIDIHDENELVLSALQKRGIYNVKLYKGNGKELPIEDNTVDVIYSFIVFQHLEKIEIFKKYIEESFKKLKPGGIAVIYFGRECKYSKNAQKKWRYQIDLIREKYILPKGYIELESRVNETNLKVTLPFAKKEAKNNGFRILKTLVSKKKVPDGIHLMGGQHGLIIRKDANTKEVNI